MCVCLTSVHSKTSGHLFVFVYVREYTPVLVCALRAVCLCLSLSLYVSGPLSRCVWLLVYACLQDCVWVCMCVSVSVPTGHCVSLICACLSRAASIPRECLFVSVGPCGLSVSEEMCF